jgi:uncharacterized protein
VVPEVVSEESLIIETEKLGEIKYLLVALPDTGLVGTIALGYTIQSKKMREVGYVTPRALPPMLVIHNGEPKSPVRIYADNDFAALISEAPLPSENYKELTHHLARWATEKKTGLLISLTGIGIQDRVEVTKPQVFGIGGTAEVRDLLKSRGLLPLEEGFVVGPQAILLNECIEKTVPIAVLLAQSHTQFPDPAAAAAMLEQLNQAFGFSIEVKELEQEAEEFRIRLRELMQRTQQSMRGMKSQEGELPALYT